MSAGINVHLKLDGPWDAADIPDIVRAVERQLRAHLKPAAADLTVEAAGKRIAATL